MVMDLSGSAGPGGWVRGCGWAATSVPELSDAEIADELVAGASQRWGSLPCPHEGVPVKSVTGSNGSGGERRDYGGTEKTRLGVALDCSPLIEQESSGVRAEVVRDDEHGPIGPARQRLGQGLNCG